MGIIGLLASVVISASIDSATIMLGDQTALNLEVTQSKADQVDFPVYGETLCKDLEIVGRTDKDTTLLDDDRLQIKQTLTLTSFEDSLFYIESIPFLVNGDTMHSAPLTLNVVQPFVIDSADNTLADIKPIEKAPIWWWGIIRWILLGLLIAGLGVGGYFLYRWLKKRKQAQTDEPIDPELLRPCEEVALEKLDKIKEEKIWQAGRHKEYFTDLTDVVREYIARRFDVHSGKKTSEETLAEMKPILAADDKKALYEELKQTLTTADLVKFAKWSTTPDENENALRIAYKFVHETTPTPAEEGKENTPEESENK